MVNLDTANKIIFALLFVRLGLAILYVTLQRSIFIAFNKIGVLISLIAYSACF